MIDTKKAIYLIALILLSTGFYTQTKAQSSGALSLIVLNEKSQPAEGAGVKQLIANKLIKSVIVNAKGIALFEGLNGNYTFTISLYRL
jgi:hypothetical protein